MFTESPSIGSAIVPILYYSRAGYQTEKGAEVGDSWVDDGELDILLLVGV